MEYTVQNLTEKGKFEDSDFGAVSFNDIDRAKDLRDYLGGNHVVTFETHRGYRIVINNSKPGSAYGLIITANQDTDTEHFIAYAYMGDSYNQCYLGSKSYGTFKGASKKVRQYLS